MQVCQVSASSSLRFLRRKILNIFSKIYPLCRPINKSNQAIWTIVVRNMEDYSINISVKKLNIPNDVEEIVNFHFSNYKSMETLSYHSNQSSYPNKKHNFCRGQCPMQVCQVKASSSLRFLRRKILNIFSKIYPLCRSINKSNQAIWTKVVRNMEDYSINISVKKSNIPNDVEEIVNFHFSNYKSMETLSYHSNQSSYPTKIKNITFVEGKALSKYAKFRLHPLSEKKIFYTFLRKLTLFASPTTNQIYRFGQKSYET